MFLKTYKHAKILFFLLYIGMLFLSEIRLRKLVDERENLIGQVSQAPHHCPKNGFTYRASVAKVPIHFVGHPGRLPDKASWVQIQPWSCLLLSMSSFPQSLSCHNPRYVSPKCSLCSRRVL